MITKLLTTIFVLIALNSTVIAQAFNDVNNVQVTLTKYDNVDGSPYLTDEWATGSVKLANVSKPYTNLLLKYNQESDQLYFKGQNGVILSFLEPVAEFSINYNLDGIPHTSRYKNGYKSIAGTIVNSFFEVLADGNVQLLKKTFNTIEEQKNYGSAITERKMASTVKYFIYTNGKAVLVKPNIKSLLTVLADKQTQLKSYIENESIHSNSDEDLTKIVSYYNSI
ncbi:hypothetical protein GCM10027037_11360 [Mucilaginibacter koreensis]